jgi:hypothetical protein
VFGTDSKIHHKYPQGTNTPAYFSEECFITYHRNLSFYFSHFNCTRKNKLESFSLALAPALPTTNALAYIAARLAGGRRKFIFIVIQMTFNGHS